MAKPYRNKYTQVQIEVKKAIFKKPKQIPGPKNTLNVTQSIPPHFLILDRKKQDRMDNCKEILLYDTMCLNQFFSRLKKGQYDQ